MACKFPYNVQSKLWSSHKKERLKSNDKYFLIMIKMHYRYFIYALLTCNNPQMFNMIAPTLSCQFASEHLYMYIWHINMDSLSLEAFMYIAFGWPLRWLCLLNWEVYSNIAFFWSGHANSSQTTKFFVSSR